MAISLRLDLSADTNTGTFQPLIKKFPALPKTVLILIIKPMRSMKPVTKNIYQEVILASLIGALVGFLISLWRENTLAIFLCGTACGGTAFLRAYFRNEKGKF